MRQKTLDQLLDDARVEVIALQNQKRQAENRARISQINEKNATELVNVWAYVSGLSFVVLVVYSLTH